MNKSDWKCLATRRYSVTQVQEFLQESGYLTKQQPTGLAKMHGLYKRGEWDRHVFARLRGNKKKTMKRYVKILKEHLWNLGYERYSDYLSGSYWAHYRECYFMKHEKVCFLCNKHGGIQLHHLCYDRLGSEQEGDVVPLCDDCHCRAHRLINKGIPINRAHLLCKKRTKRHKETKWVSNWRRLWNYVNHEKFTMSKIYRILESRGLIRESIPTDKALACKYAKECGGKILWDSRKCNRLLNNHLK